MHAHVWRESDFLRNKFSIWRILSMWTNIFNIWNILRELRILSYHQFNLNNYQYRQLNEGITNHVIWKSFMIIVSYNLHCIQQFIIFLGWRDVCFTLMYVYRLPKWYFIPSKIENKTSIFKTALWLIFKRKISIG